VNRDGAAQEARSVYGAEEPRKTMDEVLEIRTRERMSMSSRSGKERYRGSSWDIDLFDGEFGLMMAAPRWERKWERRGATPKGLQLGRVGADSRAQIGADGAVDLVLLGLVGDKWEPRGAHRCRSHSGRWVNGSQF
jgi:hypothetical protein